MTLLINLLPDLRQAKLKDRRRRQLATGVAISVWVVCGSIIALLSVYAAGQKVIIAATTKSVQNNEASLQSVTGLVEALTANQHLAALPGLYSKRVYISKFFTALMESDPVAITISSLQVDSAGVMTVLGTGPTYADVAKIARALEASNVKVGSGAAETNDPYFTDVNISSVDNSDKTGVSFTISATLAPGVTSVSSK